MDLASLLLPAQQQNQITPEIEQAFGGVQDRITGILNRNANPGPSLADIGRAMTRASGGQSYGGALEDIILGQQEQAMNDLDLEMTGLELMLKQNEMMAQQGNPKAVAFQTALQTYGFDQLEPAQRAQVMNALQSHPTELDETNAFDLVGEAMGGIAPVMDQTDDITEYQFAVGQGYTGTLNDWMLEKQRAGATTITEGDINLNTGQNALQDVDKAVLTKQGEGAELARVSIPKYERILQALETVQTGTGTETIMEIGKVLSQLGVPIDMNNISEQEVIRALGTELATLVRVPGSGQTSNFEMDLYLKAQPRLSTTKEGNRKLAEGAIKIARRKIAEYRIARQHMATYGYLDDSYWQEVEGLGSIFSPKELSDFQASPVPAPTGGSAIPPPPPGFTVQ